MSPPLFTYARDSVAADVIIPSISSATAPATAAIGVMNMRSQYGVTAATIRLAMTPAGSGFRSRVPFRRNSSSPAKFVEHVAEAFRGCTISSVDLVRLAEGFDDQVDRTVMKMKSAAIFQQPHLGSWFHSDFPRASGHGLSGLADTLRCPLPSMIESSGRTWSM